MTQTVWYPLDDGAFNAIGGKLLGSKIPFIEKPPIMTLDEWWQLHPHTLVLLGDEPESDDAEPESAKTSLP